MKNQFIFVTKDQDEKVNLYEFKMPSFSTSEIKSIMEDIINESYTNTVIKKYLYTELSIKDFLNTLFKNYKKYIKNLKNLNKTFISGLGTGSEHYKDDSLLITDPYSINFIEDSNDNVNNLYIDCNSFNICISLHNIINIEFNIWKENSSTDKIYLNCFDIVYNPYLKNLVYNIFIIEYGHKKMDYKIRYYDDFINLKLECIFEYIFKKSIKLLNKFDKLLFVHNNCSYNNRKIDKFSKFLVYNKDNTKKEIIYDGIIEYANKEKKKFKSSKEDTPRNDFKKFVFKFNSYGITLNSILNQYSFLVKELKSFDDKLYFSYNTTISSNNSEKMLDDSVDKESRQIILTKNNYNIIKDTLIKNKNNIFYIDYSTVEISESYSDENGIKDRMTTCSFLMYTMLKNNKEIPSLYFIYIQLFVFTIENKYIYNIHIRSDFNNIYENIDSINRTKDIKIENNLIFEGTKYFENKNINNNNLVNQNIIQDVLIEVKNIIKYIKL